MTNESEELEKYADKYTDEGLWSKLSAIASKLGGQVVYTIMLLYYSLQNPQLSNKDRAIIIGALGYFILPIDLVPDFIVGLGYTDDIATLTYAIRTIYVNITPEIKEKAQIAVLKYFPDFKANNDLPEK